MQQQDLQSQLISHVDFIFSEMNQIVSLLKDDKLNTALMCLGILFHHVTVSNKALEVHRVKPEAPAEETQAVDPDISPVV